MRQSSEVITIINCFSLGLILYVDPFQYGGIFSVTCLSSDLACVVNCKSCCGCISGACSVAPHLFCGISHFNSFLFFRRTISLLLRSRVRRSNRPRGSSSVVMRACAMRCCWCRWFHLLVEVSRILVLSGGALLVKASGQLEKIILLLF